MIKLPSRVFVTQTPKKTIDISPALDFGEIIIVVETTTNIRNPQLVVSQARLSMKDFTTNDYICLIGDPVLCGILCAVAAQRTGGEFTALKWDRQETRYIPIKVVL